MEHYRLQDLSAGQQHVWRKLKSIVLWKREDLETETVIQSYLGKTFIACCNRVFGRKETENCGFGEMSFLGSMLLVVKKKSRGECVSAGQHQDAVWTKVGQNSSLLPVNRVLRIKWEKWSFEIKTQKKDFKRWRDFHKMKWWQIEGNGQREGVNKWYCTNDK